MRVLSTAFACLTFAAASQAQSFNVDVGDNLILFPVPQSNYVGAANQGGVWNSSKFPYSHVLVRLNGNPSSVATSSNSTSSYNYFPSSLTGDDYNFMVDIQNLPFIGGPWTWNFSGLLNGNYQLYTYAWAPENNGFQTSVDVPGSVDPAQSVGGFWFGSPHVLGVTYARHNVTVTNGTLQVVVEGLNTHDGSVNGFQLVQLSTLPTVYCTGKLNTQGCTPGVGSTGAPSFSAGSGFSVNAAQVVDNQNGLLFYSTSVAASIPFLGGTLCATQPLTRTPIQNSGGGGACGGAYGFDFNAWMAGGADPALAPGIQVYAQYWYRDPADAFTVGLTDALTFEIGP